MKTILATAFVGLSLPILGAPTSAFADTSLGGYNASATASVVRVQVFEPALPIPTSPQLDGTIAFARSQTTTGPSSRALASYLWPSDTLGDGIGVLTGNDALDYPVKVNSKYPATAAAPAQNTAQITDGNGMTTSADGTTTKSTVNAAEIGGNLLSGIGTGLCTMLKQPCTEPALPLPTGSPLAGVATMDVGRSQSTVVLQGGEITAAARSTASGLSLLGGLITIGGVDMQSTAVSDGTKASTDGFAKITGLRVAGQAVDLGDPVNLGGTKTAIPVTPIDVAPIGVKIDYLKSTKSVDAASGALSIEGLTITIDASVLSTALHTGALTGPLAPYLGKIDQLGPLLNGLLKFGTKLVITVGDARSSASATPAYAGTPTGPTSSTVTTPGSTTGGSTSVAPSVSVPAGAQQPPTAAAPQLTSPVNGIQPTSFAFPGLGQTPSILLLGALLLALLVGWLFRGIGAFFLRADNCLLGASVGVPNLREG